MLLDFSNRHNLLVFSNIHFFQKFSSVAFFILFFLDVESLKSPFFSNRGFRSSQQLNECRYSLGIDFGTSGVRACLINRSEKFEAESIKIIEDVEMKYSDYYDIRGMDATVGQNHDDWINVMLLLLGKISKSNIPMIGAVSLCGTSGSALVFDKSRNMVTRNVRMYDYNVLKGNRNMDNIGENTMQIIENFSSSGSSVNSPTSALAKLLSWHLESPLSHNEILAHQADYVLMYLLTGDGNRSLNLGGYGYTSFISDWNNALKLGFDVISLAYPPWLMHLLNTTGISYPNLNPNVGNTNMHTPVLPTVVEPGSAVGTISNFLVEKYSFRKDCKIVAGTTDSIAAFLASGANKPGQAVTSLGSTLALKLVSEKYVEDAKRGIYSHRLGDHWLVGGASNVGCAILRQEKFSNEELRDLSENINDEIDAPYVYYPLCKPGERFPFNDPNKEPILFPKPTNLLNLSNYEYRRVYLHCILQGIANVEKLGYAALQDLGASPLVEVMTAGGGARNSMWTSMRQRMLGVPTRSADNIDAAFGCALLAQKALTISQMK